MKAYTIGVVPPVVLVTPNAPLIQNARIATIRVTNPDSNTGITINTVNITLNANSPSRGNFSFAGLLCLRDVGSNASCGSAGTTAGQSVTQTGGSYTFNITGSTLANANIVLNKNGGNVEYEVYLDNAPLWVAGDNVNIRVNNIDYNAGNTTFSQSYAGISGASATTIR